MLKLRTVICTFLLTSIFSSTVLATSVRIESHDKTIYTGQVTEATTLQEVLSSISEKNNIEVQYKKNNGVTIISAINGVENNLFGNNDGWYTYINKNGEVLMGDNPLNTIIEKDDEIVVYYGHIEDTKIINTPSITIDGRDLDFKINSDFSPAGIKIHVKTPKDTQRILISDETGIVTTKVNDLGNYKYFGEYYNYSDYPKVVKTEEKQFFVGPIDKNKVTRGESIDYIINHLGITSNNRTNPFTDVTFGEFYYVEALVAYHNNIISGYDDGSFQGDSYITLSELSIMLSRAKDATSVQSKSYDTNAPEWAKNSVNYCIDKGIFTLDDDFTRFVTLDDLNKINY